MNRLDKGKTVEKEAQTRITSKNHVPRSSCRCSFGEADKLEFESRGLAENTLDLEFESSWVIIRNGMAMQEREVPDNVTVQTQESEDDTHRYKSVGATVAGVPVIELWKTPKAQRIRVVLPSSPDPLTGSYRIQPTTPTPVAKKPRYTGPGGSAGPSAVNRRLSFKSEEEEEEAGDEGEGEGKEEEGEFILGEEEDRMDYQAEIPDTQDDEATFIRTWETANLLSIAQLGDIYLKTRKLTTKQADGVTDLLAAIDKVFDLDLCIQTIDDSGKATSDVRKAVARMKSGIMKETWMDFPHGRDKVPGKTTVASTITNG